MVLCVVGDVVQDVGVGHGFDGRVCGTQMHKRLVVRVRVRVRVREDVVNLAASAEGTSHSRSAGAADAYVGAATC